MRTGGGGTASVSTICIREGRREGGERRGPAIIHLPSLKACIPNSPQAVIVSRAMAISWSLSSSVSFVKAMASSSLFRSCHSSPISRHTKSNPKACCTIVHIRCMKIRARARTQTGTERMTVATTRARTHVCTHAHTKTHLALTERGPFGSAARGVAARGRIGVCQHVPAHPFAAQRFATSHSHVPTLTIRSNLLFWILVS